MRMADSVLLDVLAACTAGAEGVDLQILGVDGELRLLRLRHHRHRGGGGLDAVRADSVSGTRCTRWVPASIYDRDHAPSPSTVAQTSLTPPSSVTF